MSQGGNIIGVDTAKDRVDCVQLVDGVLKEFASFDAPKDVVAAGRGPVLHWLHHEVGLWILPLNPRAIFVEENIVRGSGVTTRVLGQSVGMLLSISNRCETVTVQQWKLAAVGNGNAAKDQVRAGIVRRMPETDALYGKRQDLFDATGVAIYGNAVCRRR